MEKQEKKLTELPNYDKVFPKGETTREKLMFIQAELNAPKNQYNKFGGYAYRSCEDIYNALKPLLAKYGCTLTLSDEVVMVGERYYVKATATLKPADVKLSGFEITNTAYAREEETKKGLDSSQITGSCSSYARKYALNGLFAIDDTKDADALNTSPEFTKSPLDLAIEEINKCRNREELTKVWNKYKEQYKNDPAFVSAATDRGKEIAA